jgi:hypothetical protein
MRGDILESTGLDHLQNIFQEGLGNPMKIVLHINHQEGTMSEVDLSLPLPIGFQFLQHLFEIKFHGFFQIGLGSTVIRGEILGFRIKKDEKRAP